MKVIRADNLWYGYPLCNRANRILKRVFDIVFSLLVLLFIYPPAYLIIGIAIKCAMPGAPVIFRQKRTGKRGKVFTCYKFRSMIPNGDSDLLQARENDMRITPLGAFLRRTCLDELPQFWNILIGDMSIVGPRPHMIAHTIIYSPLIPNYNKRLEVKPGLTGWAQVYNLRGETYNAAKMHKRVQFDLWYIQNWSFLLDLHIIQMTVKLVLSDLLTFGKEEKSTDSTLSPQFANEEVQRCTV
ncbi:MAG: sugar transferase [Prevotellaceae bacterium]|jgi:putative colanic acid biosynthesis UDP-glucose lipid carrier transferase|nr:sugar transferase [Prevotellaceae bacterium]